MRRFKPVLLALAFTLVVPAFAVAKGPSGLEVITLSTPLPAHVNERNHLSGSVRIKRMTPVGTFCFNIDFAEPGINVTSSFFVVVDGMTDHTIVQAPDTIIQNPAFNPRFVSLCTTDPATLAAVGDGRFTFLLGTWQGSFDVTRIHTSNSPPA